MTRKQLRETLAALIHDHWQAWTTRIVGQHEEKLPKELVTKWKQNWRTYTDLPERIKDKNRLWADKVLAIIPKSIKSATTEEPKEPSQVKPVFELFTSICEKAKGFKPELTYGIEGKMIKDKLKKYSVDDLKELFIWYFKSEDSKKLGCSLKVVLSNYVVNKWLQDKVKPKFRI